MKMSLKIITAIQKILSSKSNRETTATTPCESMTPTIEEEKPTTIKITKEAISTMEVVTFSGKIVVVESAEDAIKEFKYLSKFKIVGVDTESKPSFKKGKSNKVSLLQVSTQDRAILFRLNKIGNIDELVAFFENKNQLKIGLSLRDDFLVLREFITFTPLGFIDLQDIVDKYKIGEKSLQKIYAILFGKRISKSQRMSNWENETLSPSQQLYAAIDAWTPLQIYNALQTPNITDLYQKEIIKLA